jgi:YD repeat-containing protein
MDGYDTVGHLKAMTDFNGHIVTYVYDEQNRLTEKQFQDGSKVQYGYLRNGLQDTVTFRNSAGLVTSFYDYDYDVRDRLTKRTDSIDGVARSINYGYDIASNRTSVTTASGTSTYSYDDRNRLDVTRFNGAIVADYDYDAASRLTKTTFGNGTEETRVYRANAYISSYFRGRTGRLSQYFEQVVIIPSGFKALGMGPALGGLFLGNQIDRQVTDDGEIFTTIAL